MGKGSRRHFPKARLGLSIRHCGQIVLIVYGTCIVARRMEGAGIASGSREVTENTSSP